MRPGSFCSLSSVSLSVAGTHKSLRDHEPGTDRDESFEVRFSKEEKERPACIVIDLYLAVHSGVLMGLVHERTIE